jgi:hypothetical protein
MTITTQIYQIVKTLRIIESGSEERGNQKRSRSRYDSKQAQDSERSRPPSSL